MSDDKEKLEDLYKTNTMYIVNTILVISIMYSICISIGLRLSVISNYNILPLIGFTSTILVQLHNFKLANVFLNAVLAGCNTDSMYDKVIRFDVYRDILFISSTILVLI